ncbi:MAG: AAA family ATPase [Chitinophagales bacterium]|nr:AAA family ATPase [Chitinophagales bacterium]
MITYLKINGFKSFHNFEVSFTPLTVIAGINASGKSNLFDALSLLSRLAEVDNIKKAFKEQHGEFIELFTQLDRDVYAQEIEFCVEMLVNRTIKDAWGNKAPLRYTCLRYELTIRRQTNSSGIEDLVVVAEHLENLKHLEDNWVKQIPKETLRDWRPEVKTGKKVYLICLQKQKMLCQLYLCRKMVCQAIDGASHSIIRRERC